MTKSVRSYIYGGACMIAAAIAVVPAQATTRDLGTIAEGEKKGAVLSHEEGDFSDSILFSIVVGGSDAFASYFNFLVGTSSHLSNTFLNLTGPSAQSFALTDGLVKQITLAAGTYTANITGTVTGSDGGAYNFRIAAPTPEPEIWLSMLAGAGLAGFMARRRKRNATVNA